MPTLPGLVFLQAYPPEQIWRLFVDGRFWSKENGWHGYESREKGSINAALESLCSMALYVDKAGEKFELNVDLIKDIHKRCGRKVEELEEKSPGEIRTDEPVSFGIPASRASIKGIEEFLRLFFLIEGGASFGPGIAGSFGPKFDIDYFNGLTVEKIPELAKKIYEDMCAYGHNNTNHFYLAVRTNVGVYLEAITQSYNKEIKAANTLDDKLLVIAKHIRQYEVLHPFKDANGRTFVNNLLNILLMQQGLPPATFYEPNVFDLYSTEELAVVIKEAIFNTLEIIEQNKKGVPLYGYSATMEDNKQFIGMLDSPSYHEIRELDVSRLDVESMHRETQKCLASLDETYPLHRGAIYLSEPHGVKELVSAYASQINQRIEQGAPPIYVGKTPIHLAAMMRNIVMVDELIAKKADLSIQDYDGKTVLHHAAESGNMQIMGKVLTAILSRDDALTILNIKDNEGKTAFHYAAEYGSLELIGALTSTDVIQIDEPDNKGSSAITLAYKNYKLDVFEKLLASGAEISPALLKEVMVRKDKDALVKILAKNKQLLLSKEVFEIALYIGSTSLVKQFLRAGMDINIRITKEGGTALVLATNTGNIKLAGYLLRKGADTRILDIHGGTLLHHVFYTNAEHREELTRKILKKDPGLINIPNKVGRPPLYSAVSLKDFNMMRLLLAQGAKIDFEDADGNNALHIAFIGTPNISMIQEILSWDSTLLHKRNQAGRNPFHHALSELSHYSKKEEAKFLQLCDYLLKEKVDLNTKDVKGKTVLDVALSKNHYHLCVKLMKGGAQTSIASAAEFLEGATTNSISEHPKTFKKKLGKMLDKNPLIAMAQLNDLYIQIKKNHIKTPKDFAPQGGLSFFKGKSEDSRSHELVLSVLKELYDAKLKLLLDSYQGQSEDFEKKHRVIDENLKFLIKNQEILKKKERPTTQIVEGEHYGIKW